MAKYTIAMRAKLYLSLLVWIKYDPSDIHKLFVTNFS